MSRKVVLNQIETSVPNKIIEVEVWYNDGSMNRNSRGYFLSARIWTEENGFRTTDIFGGSKSVVLEKADRFSEKKLRELAHSANYDYLVQSLLEKLS